MLQELTTALPPGTKQRPTYPGKRSLNLRCHNIAGVHEFYVAKRV